MPSKSHVIDDSLPLVAPDEPFTPGPLLKASRTANAVKIVAGSLPSTGHSTCSTAFREPLQLRQRLDSHQLLAACHLDHAVPRILWLRYLNPSDCASSQECPVPIVFRLRTLSFNCSRKPSRKLKPRPVFLSDTGRGSLSQVFEISTMSTEISFGIHVLVFQDPVFPDLPAGPLADARSQGSCHCKKRQIGEHWQSTTPRHPPALSGSRCFVRSFS